jgi:hypothetical protein
MNDKNGNTSGNPQDSMMAVSVTQILDGGVVTMTIKTTCFAGGIAGGAYPLDNEDSSAIAGAVVEALSKIISRKSGRKTSTDLLMATPVMKMGEAEIGVSVSQITPEAQDPSRN